MGKAVYFMVTGRATLVESTKNQLWTQNSWALLPTSEGQTFTNGPFLYIRYTNEGPAQSGGEASIFRPRLSVTVLMN